ncbi:MAG: DNA topoisomerase IV [Acidobacteria bacterium]|nr:MAG: DNA topoisomerase IV [Acidobacteriota bacterium]
MNKKHTDVKLTNRVTGKRGEKVNYDEDAIKTLSSLIHIRTRPGMYIGRLGTGSHPDDGIYILIKEIVDNCIDEYIMGHGKRIEITVDKSDEAKDRVKIRDYGRGIPLGKLVDCVSIINTGGKFNDDVFQFSVGLNGVGTKAVNALSSRFLARSTRDGEMNEAIFHYGELQGKKNTRYKKTDERNGTYIEFDVDRTIFPEKVKINLDFLKKRIQYYAYLNTGLTLILNGERFYSRHGLKDLLEAEVGDSSTYEPIYYKDSTLEFSFCHTPSYGENFFSFVNGQHTHDGGTHLSAFREGLTKGINEYAGKSFQGVDIRDGMVGAIAIKIKEPVFESQTKNKLGNTDVKSWIVNAVKQEVSDFLHKNQDDAKALIEKISNNERLRKQLHAVKQEAKKKAKAVSIKVPGLKDCKYHLGDKKYGEESCIFLTEGQSAMGSMVSSRDARVQALFSLRGKPLNVFGSKREAIYKNNELYNVMKALGIEEGIEFLRYNKVIIATDADVDGLHIRNLLITYFLHFFDELVTSGHLYILETPIFRVRNKKETLYCYSDDEREKALQVIKNPEITRFKGLGEISPKEFGQFIGPDMKIVPVQVDHLQDVDRLLTFYMGGNTPKRRQYIMDHLI